MDILAKMENMPLTYTLGEGWELFDELTGEIFNVPNERAGKALRNMAIQHDRIVWDFARVRSDHRNEWSDYKYVAFSCNCCGAPLNEIDPYNICMDCVDMNCNVKDEN
jgi:hypothetical protein